MKSHNDNKRLSLQKTDDDFVYQRAFIFTVGPSLFLLIFIGGLRAFNVVNAPSAISISLGLIILIAFFSYCWVNRVALAKHGRKTLDEKPR